MSASHHNSEEEQEEAKKLHRFIEELTGTADRKWPQGRIEGEDDGETAFAIAADPRNKIVRIQFSKPMHWLGLGEVEARQLGEMLIQKANELKGATIPR